MEVKDFEMLSWNDPTQPAEYECTFKNIAAGTYTGTVSIACIAVP
jgi:hypothetical protein